MSNLGKPNLILLIGPPCSGKSTYCELYKNMKHVVRVNQDDIRGMFSSGDMKAYWQNISGAREQSVYDINIMSTKFALAQGLTVLLDNTHCNPKTLKEIIRLFPEVKIEAVIFDSVPLWKLKWRNIVRYIKTGGNVWIPPNVIENMHKKLPQIRKILEENKIDIIYG